MRTCGAPLKIFTIGFTKKTARRFFEAVCMSGAARVVDVRLNNISQLSGFAKKDDLAYFLKKRKGALNKHFPVRSFPKAASCAAKKSLITAIGVW